MSAGRFLSWARPGLLAQARAGGTLDATLSVETGAGARDVTVSLPLAGPAAMLGLAADAVVHRNPAPRTPNFRAGELPFATFADPTLPWALSPGTPAGGGLQPAVALLCLPDTADTVFVPGADPLPRIEARNIGAALPDGNAPGARFLPDPGDLAFAAHVHDPDPAPPDGGVGPRAVARVLCIQRLAPNTAWRAVLVPVHAAAAAAGLGEDPDGASGFAWEADDDALTLPVYDTWTFATGAGRGVEDMLRDLRAAPPPPADSTDVLTIAPEFAAAAPMLAGRTVARRTILVAGTPPAPAPDADLSDALATRLPDGARRLPLPSYGAAHAGAPDAAAAPPAGWFGALNRDPGLRRLAGAGAALARERQEPLVAFVRDAAGALDEANAILSRAHMARSVNASLADAVANLGDAQAVAFAGPALARIAADDADGRATTAATAAAPMVDAQLADPAMKRMLSIRGLGSAPLQPADLGADHGRAALFDVISDAGAADAVAGASLDPALAAAALDLPDAARRDFADEDEERRGSFADLLGLLLELPRNRLIPAPEEPEPWRATARAERARPASRSRPRLAPPDLAGKVRAALDPERSVPPRVAGRLQGAGLNPDEPLPPRITVDPVWPEPILEQLFAAAPELLAPALDAVPADAIVGLRYDPAAMEALMVGANHEVIRELRWRGLPVRRAVSPMRRAFPRPLAGGEDPAPDIAPLATWGDRALGDNAQTGAGLDFVALLRSELLRRAPDLVVTLAPAERGPDGARRPRPSAPQVAPALQGRLGEDMGYLGFPPVPGALRGDPATGDEGWFLVFTQAAGDITFGLNADAGAPPRAPGDLGGSWNALAWSDLAGAAVLSSDALPGQGGPGGIDWGTSGAAMAAILCERPVIAAFHLSDLLPPAP